MHVLDQRCAALGCASRSIKREIGRHTGDRSAPLRRRHPDREKRALMDRGRLHEHAFRGLVGGKCISMLREGHRRNRSPSPASREGERTAAFVPSSTSSAALVKKRTICRAADRGTFIQPVNCSQMQQKQKVWMKTLVIAEAPSPNHPGRCSRVGGLEPTDPSIIKGPQQTR